MTKLTVKVGGTHIESLIKNLTSRERSRPGASLMPETRCHRGLAPRANLMGRPRQPLAVVYGGDMSKRIGAQSGTKRFISNVLNRPLLGLLLILALIVGVWIGLQLVLPALT